MNPMGTACVLVVIRQLCFCGHCKKQTICRSIMLLYQCKTIGIYLNTMKKDEFKRLTGNYNLTLQHWAKAWIRIYLVQLIKQRKYCTLSHTLVTASSSKLNFTPLPIGSLTVKFGEKEKTSPSDVFIIYYLDCAFLIMKQMLH